MSIKRPPYIVSTRDVPEIAGKYYPNSPEVFGHGRAIGQFAGLLRIGLHIERLSPGERSSMPHAEQDQEEFVYVLEGTVNAWIQGELFAMVAGDLAAFPAGTGIAHVMINDSDADALLLVGGERNKSDNKIVYPLNPERRNDLPWSLWWADAPVHALGPHDGTASPREGNTPASE
ncbi:MAG: cupin domain-containing protein [Deltaproteobacteria bacterium]|nr:cupin domain-containing protein [Deltaproteobacteria bacterium]